MTEINIVDLIEKNPITRLTNTYQNKLLEKIKNNFNDGEQQIFVASFYCYLNFNKTDFVIDLDNIWNWLGFTNKANAKKLLEKYFIPDIDYKCLLDASIKQKNGRGGHNKETFMLTIKTFKSLCLKADTEKAGQIHEYYLKLEELLQEVLYEESTELRHQLENNKNEKNILLENTQKDKESLREKTLLEQFTDNTQCVYYGLIDNKSEHNEPLIKFGNSNNLRDRVLKHKNTFTNFRLASVFKVDNKTQIENAIKNHPLLIEKKRIITINNKKHVELLALGDFTFDNFDSIIKDIVKTIEYSPENYKKILNENDSLTKKNILLMDEIEKYKTSIKNNNTIQCDDTIVNKLKNDILLLTEENEKIKIDNIKLLKKYKIDKKIVFDDVVLDNHIIENTVINDSNYNSITNNLKRISKNYQDGLYYIGDFKYKKCFGSREEVWNRIAYKTVGNLVKDDLMYNKLGKIVSKKKFLYEKQSNRLDVVNKKA